jgi:hypothetical protein
MDEASRMARADAIGFRRGMPVYGSVVPEGEKIMQAAVKVGDRVFTGPNHAIAIERAEAAFGSPFEKLPLDAFPDGFVTTSGRYVSRHEAMDIAAATRQWTGPMAMPGFKGLASEDTRMAIANPSAARRRVNRGATASDLPGGGEGVWVALELGIGTTPLWHRASNPVQMDVRNADLPAIHSTLVDAWGQGIDAVLLRNYIPPGGGGRNVLVVKDPAQLRDPKARFDPAKINSRNVMASGAGLGLFAPLAFPLAQQRSEPPTQ